MSAASGFSESYSGELAMISRLALSSLKDSVPSCCSSCNCGSVGCPGGAPEADEARTLASDTLARPVSTTRQFIAASPNISQPDSSALHLHEFVHGHQVVIQVDHNP